MLVVKLELWPKGLKQFSKEIGRIYIANDGTGTKEKGNYKIAVCRRGTQKCPWFHRTKAVREGSVKNFSRLRHNPWRLISRCLLACFPEEKE